MAYAVFTTKVSPTYDDLPEERYHFPATYLRQAQAALGDWIVYYEPRRASGDLSSRGGRSAYFAVARLISIDPDPANPGQYYARVEDFLEFERAVPFREDGRYYESALEREDGGTSKGAFGRSVRNLDKAEFDAILAAGFPSRADSFEDDEPETVERPTVSAIISRPFRDRAFRTNVRRAYRRTCAISGLTLFDRMGRPEVHAAHIRPVEAGGPDSVRNGLSLCGTVHWMFDHGLISVADDFAILLSSSFPEPARRLIRAERRLLLPDREDCLPHRGHLAFHRTTIFCA
jgi:putative restriction endonuclease